jgi:hypothetical protein
METKFEPSRSTQAINPFDKSVSNTQWSSESRIPSGSTQTSLNSSMPNAAATPVKPGKSGSSFLDDWLSKRQTKSPTSQLPNDSHSDINADTKNISSSSIDKGEIDQLAAQLRRNLATQADDKSDKGVKANNEPSKNLEKNKSNNKLSDSDTLESQTQVLTDKNSKNEDPDTIFIDQEGELHLR